MKKGKETLKYLLYFNSAIAFKSTRKNGLHANLNPTKPAHRRPIGSNTGNRYFMRFCMISCVIIYFLAVTYRQFSYFFRCNSMQCWHPQVVIHTEMLIAVIVIIMRNLE